MDRCGRGAALTILAQCARRSSGVISIKAIAPDREQLTLEDGARACSGAVCHRGIHQPFLAELAEALGLLQAALLALLLDRR